LSHTTQCKGFKQAIKDRLVDILLDGNRWCINDDNIYRDIFWCPFCGQKLEIATNEDARACNDFRKEDEFDPL